MWWSFNSRPRVGGEPRRGAVQIICGWLQLTPPCVGEPVDYGTTYLFPELQLTPPCVGEHVMVVNVNIVSVASTHAPVCGRTAKLHK